MNVAGDGGGGSGNGQNPAPQPTPPAPNGAPAPQPNPPAAAAQPQFVTVEQMKAMLDERDNKFFANLRRTGVIKDAKRTETPPGEQPPAPTNPSSSSLDLQKARSLDRTLSRTGLAAKLTERQYTRLERDFAADNPDDVEGWVKEYFEGFGGSQPAAATAASPQSPTTAQPHNARPITAAAPPPAPQQVPLEEADLLTLSPSDRQKVLDAKGIKWFTDQLHKQVNNRTFKLVK